MPDIGDRVRHIDEELNLIGTVIDVEGEAAGKPSGWVTVQWDEQIIHQDELEADGTQ